MFVQLAGGKYWEDVIPAEWIEKLVMRGAITPLAGGLYCHATCGTRAWMTCTDGDGLPSLPKNGKGRNLRDVHRGDGDAPAGSGLNLFISVGRSFPPGSLEALDKARTDVSPKEQHAGEQVGEDRRGVGRDQAVWESVVPAQDAVGSPGHRDRQQCNQRGGRQPAQCDANEDAGISAAPMIRR